MRRCNSPVSYKHVTAIDHGDVSGLAEMMLIATRLHARAQHPVSNVRTRRKTEHLNNQTPNIINILLTQTMYM